MKEELAEKAQTAMIDIIDTVVNVKDFAIDQAPEVISQLLLWKTTETLLGFLFGLILSGLCAYGLKKWYGKIEWGAFNDNSDIGWVFTLIASVLICGIIVLCNLLWLKILIAPKLYLIEYAASLVA